jgi:DNA-binding HxlR family transcriptional regulator
MSSQYLLKEYSLDILAYLQDGPKRYNYIQKALKINTATLTRRLEEMMKVDLISRDWYRDERAEKYRLTEIAQKIVPILSTSQKIMQASLSKDLSLIDSDELRNAIKTILSCSLAKEKNISVEEALKTMDKDEIYKMVEELYEG